MELSNVVILSSGLLYFFFPVILKDITKYNKISIYQTQNSIKQAQRVGKRA